MLALFATLAVCSATPSLFVAPHTLLVESLASPEGVDTPSPRFSWLLSPAVPGARGLTQYGYEVEVTFGTTNFSTSLVVSNGTSLNPLPSLPPLPPSSLIHWRVRVWDGAASAPSAFSLPSSFTTGVQQWQGEWLCGPLGRENLFRGLFTLPPGLPLPALALVHVAGLGVHSLTFNGAPPPTGTPERKLDGGWTAYSRRVLYTTHDLTPALLPGANVLGVALGSGWYNSRGWYAQPPYGWPPQANGGGFSYPSPPLLRVQLVLTLANGSALTLAAGSGQGGWQWAAAEGPITFDSLYDGETFSGARAAALRGWDSPAYSPAPPDWAPAVAVNASANPVAGAALASQPHEPTVRTAAFPPAALSQPVPGTTVYDCGSNGVGVVRWTFRGLPPGTNATLRYAEVLQHPPYGPQDGSLYFDNLRNAHATDYYSADGSSGVETYEPTFTWHGFRYAQVSFSGPSAGSAAPPALQDVLCIRQGNAVPPGAAAAFPLPLLGALQQLATNTMVGSFQGGPGSCGNRDERQFFTGDTQVTAQASMQYFRLRPLLASWLRTGVEEQNGDGSIGYYLPTPLGDVRDGNPQWSTGFLTVAWLLLRLEGDSASVAAAHPAIQRYTAFNEAQYAAAVQKCGGLACYWPAWPSEWQQLGPTPNASCMNSMAYLRDLQMAGDIAQWLGLGGEAQALRNRTAARLAEFHAAFFNASTAAYGAGTQSEQAIALWLGAPPTPQLAASALALLLADLQAAGYKQNTGIVGMRYLHEALGAAGRADLTLRAFLDDTYPSLGFMVQGQGNPEPSDTLWELWAAHTGSPTMSSRNHLMFSSYSSALLSLAVGVSPLGPGAALGVSIDPSGLGCPLPPPAPANATGSSNATLQPLLYASGRQATPWGEVQVSWSRQPPPPPPPPYTLCGAAAEAHEPSMAYVNLSCPAGTALLFSASAFVSFGRPTGQCSGGFAADPQCSSPSARALVLAACAGQQSCSLPVDFRVYGDPCPGSVKRLAVSASGCSGGPLPPPAPPPAPPPLFSGRLNCTVPAPGRAEVRLPGPGAGSAGGVAVREGGAPVWLGGAFVPGVAGVLGARAVVGRGGEGWDVLVLVGSGEYAFEVAVQGGAEGGAAK